MKIRLVLGFAVLIVLALIQPGLVHGGELAETLAQSTPSSPAQYWQSSATKERHFTIDRMASRRSRSWVVHW